MREWPVIVNQAISQQYSLWWNIGEGERVKKRERGEIVEKKRQRGGLLLLPLFHCVDNPLHNTLNIQPDEVKRSQILNCVQACAKSKSCLFWFYNGVFVDLVFVCWCAYLFFSFLDGVTLIIFPVSVTRWIVPGGGGVPSGWEPLPAHPCWSKIPLCPPFPVFSFHRTIR